MTTLNSTFTAPNATRTSGSFYTNSDGTKADYGAYVGDTRFESTGQQIIKTSSPSAPAAKTPSNNNGVDDTYYTQSVDETGTPNNVGAGALEGATIGSTGDTSKTDDTSENKATAETIVQNISKNKGKVAKQMFQALKKKGGLKELVKSSKLAFNGKALGGGAGLILAGTALKLIPNESSPGFAGIQTIAGTALQVGGAAFAIGGQIALAGGTLGPIGLAVGAVVGAGIGTAMFFGKKNLGNRAQKNLQSALKKASKGKSDAKVMKKLDKAHKLMVKDLVKNQNMSPSDAKYEASLAMLDALANQYGTTSGHERVYDLFAEKFLTEETLIYAYGQVETVEDAVDGGTVQYADSDNSVNIGNNVVSPYPTTNDNTGFSNDYGLSDGTVEFLNEQNIGNNQIDQLISLLNNTNGNINNASNTSNNASLNDLMDLLNDSDVSSNYNYGNTNYNGINDQDAMGLLLALEEMAMYEDQMASGDYGYYDYPPQNYYDEYTYV